MSLSDLASIGTLASSVAVFVSLLYLGLQMRQNARHTKALIHQGRVARIADIQLRATEPTLAAAIIVGNGGEPTAEAIARLQFEQYRWAVFMEDTFAQHAEGLVGPDQFEGLRRGLRGMLSEPGARAFLLARIDGSPFGRFIAGVMAEAADP